MPWGPFGRKAALIKTMRQPEPSPIEALFWQVYHNLEPPELRGLVFQHKVGAYRIDFALPKYKIGIELDGHATHSSPGAIARDRKRQRMLEAAGWYIIRFGGAEVYYDAPACVIEAAKLVRLHRRSK